MWVVILCEAQIAELDTCALPTSLSKAASEVDAGANSMFPRGSRRNDGFWCLQGRAEAKQNKNRGGGHFFVILRYILSGKTSLHG